MTITNHNHKPIMHIDHNGWLQSPLCAHRPSPHYNLRPDPKDITLCVLHNITLPAGIFGEQYIHPLFLGQLKHHPPPQLESLKNLEVSTHFYIARNGKITQYISTHHRAWHAGKSCHQNRNNCNDYSIGIELNGCDHYPYTLKQYQNLAQLIKSIKKAHPQLKNITTHQEIAPERKTDPGPAFNHHYLQILLNNKPH